MIYLPHVAWSHQTDGELAVLRAFRTGDLRRIEIRGVVFLEGIEEVCTRRKDAVLLLTFRTLRSDIVQDRSMLAMSFFRNVFTALGDYDVNVIVKGMFRKKFYRRIGLSVAVIGCLAAN